MQATCSQGGGIATPSDNPGDADVYAQAYVKQQGGARKVLVVNKMNQGVHVRIPGGATARVVDQISGDGAPRMVQLSSNGTIALLPFAVAMVHF